MSELPEYQLERIFDAPRELVWRAWTDPEMLHQWYGPGAETTVHQFDLKPGGLWLNEMKWGAISNFQKVIFQEVTAPEKMVWHHYSCTDAEWNVTLNPMMADWPHLLLTTVVFEAVNDQTKVLLTQTPMDASEAEISCFKTAMTNMDHGWGAGYTLIDELLKKLQSDA